MGQIGFPEKPVTNYEFTLRNIPEEGRSHLHRGESVKSHERNILYQQGIRFKERNFLKMKYPLKEPGSIRGVRNIL
jgi:hypothetical protein